MPRRRVGATQNAEDDDEAFDGNEMDLEDAGEGPPPARKQKGSASRRTGITASTNLSAEVRCKDLKPG